MVNEEIAHIFGNMARVLAFKGGDRFDLNDVMAKAAQEAGVLLAIGSDAHSTAQMDQIRYGVSQARRGWVEARSVVNTRGWAELSRWLDRRRANKVFRIRKAVSA